MCLPAPTAAGSSLPEVLVPREALGEGQERWGCFSGMKVPDSTVHEGRGVKFSECARSVLLTPMSSRRRFESRGVAERSYVGFISCFYHV